MLYLYKYSLKKTTMKTKLEIAGFLSLFLMLIHMVFTIETPVMPGEAVVATSQIPAGSTIIFGAIGAALLLLSIRKKVVV